MISEVISLADSVEFIVDNRGKTVPVEDMGFPLIATNCISNENLYPEFSNVRYVSEEIRANWFRAHPQPNDIILTNKGSKNGAICLVPDPVTFCIAQDMVALRAKEGVIYPRYLFSVLRSPLIQSRIKELNVDSVIPHFKKTDFDKLMLPLLPYQVQIEIGDSYFELCNKIELNRQINQTLEAMAQTVFKSWFVDFEPTRAKIKAVENGQDPTRAAMAAIAGKTVDQLDTLSPDQIKTLTATAALFPDKLIPSELGEIPEGWDVTNLKSTTSELRRGISPKYCDEDGVPVVNQKCIRNHSVNFNLTRLHDPNQRKVVGRQLEVGDVLVNSTGVGTLGRLAPVRHLEGLTVFDSHVTVVRAETTKISTAFLACLMFEKETFIEASGAGSTGQTELRKQVLEDIQFTIPSKDIAKSFDAIVVPMGHQISVLEQEQENLASIRDTLLPKLLSGEIVASGHAEAPQ